MNSAVIVFVFSIGSNLFIMFLAGSAYFLPGENGSRKVDNWLIVGFQLFLWGWIAFTIRHLVFLIPAGNALFLPAFTGVFILVRSLVSSLIQQSFKMQIREKILKSMDDTVGNPMLLIPVFFIGYNGLDALDTLLVLVSSLIGCMAAYGIFRNIALKLSLESPKHGLDTSGKFLLTAAFMALIASGIDQAFFNQLLN